MNALDILKERGFIAQLTHEEETRELLEKEKITFYCGFDPTADSLHIGHFIPIMAMAHMQRAGHRPIFLMGGGTGFVGDPTDKTGMRDMMPPETINYHVECFKKQLSKFVTFEDGKAMMLNNADWLLKLNYIDFIREYGTHFSVNRMLSMDVYKSRLEDGLTFFEFNYLLLQSYDFLKLFRDHNCKLQFGGNDQWSNIIGGVELIRRVEGEQVFGGTFTILTRSDGKKMGKSEKGAVWLDRNKTTPYEFYQYFRNISDADVITYLKRLTFLPIEEINELAKLEGKEINQAKEVLAYELTKIVHNEEDAINAKKAAQALFSGGDMGGSVPETAISKEEFENGLNIIELLEKAGLIPSRGEGRRLVAGGGVKINDVKIESHEHTVSLEDFVENGELMIQKGKKIYHRIKLT